MPLRRLQPSLAIAWLALTGPAGQVIYVNPAEVISMREPSALAKQQHFPPGTRCILGTNGGGFIAVHNSCQDVFQKLADPTAR